MERLKNLLLSADENRGKWLIGNKPVHYKRLSVDFKEADRLAQLGAIKIGAAFNTVLYYSQAVIAGAILSGDYDTAIIVTPSQYGKAIENDCPVLTRHGWKKHGDLQVGDEVIGKDGEFVKVTYVHPKCMMDREVVFSTGERIKCHHNHEWYAFNKDWGNTRHGRVHEKMYRCLPTDEMLDKRIPQIKPIIGEKKDLPVDPYVFGVWLGDGTTTQGQICAAPHDLDVLDECRKYYPEGSCWNHKDTGVVTYSYKGLATDLKTYGLCRQTKVVEKFIPDDYLTASIEQRLRLLAGLLDTDGYLFAQEGRYYFTTAGEKLRDTFAELIRTFGWMPSIVTIQPKESSFGIVGKKPYYRIGFSPTMYIPCVLLRKCADKVSCRHNYPKVVDVLPCDPVEGNCITVEGGLYCVGKTLTLTHNSFLMGRICLLLAYEDHQVSVAAAAKDKTDIILSHTRKAVSEAAPEILNKLLNESKKKVDNLDKSLSKTKIGFASGGYTEALTLGDNYEDISRNKAVGIGTDFIVDEAAMISTKALRELGRRQLSSIDGKSKLLVMISNPHQPGYFYDKLTGPADKRTLILWMDALTAAQEGRWTVEQILDSDFAQEEDTRTRYWMCELPTQGKSMFGYLKVGEGWEGTHYLGVDAAYKGKDNICVADIVKGPKGLYVKEVVRIPKPHWIDGVTGQEIVRDVIRIAKGLNAKHVCVDQGYGVWLVMGLQNAHVNVTGVNFGSGPSKDRKAAKHYAARMAYNKRAEMHLDLESLTEDGKVIFSRQAYEKIQDVLPFITKSLRTNGTYMIRSKDEVKAMIGRSPDELDAVLLGIHAAITDIRPGYMV